MWWCLCWAICVLPFFIGMASSSSTCLPTTGVAETALLAALLSGCSSQEASIPALIQKGVDCKATSVLPGTNSTDPDSFDLDGYAMLLLLPSFKKHMPLVFSVTIGGSTVPASSRKIEEHHGYRYIGSLNCNINVHVPCGTYSNLMWKLRACQPAQAGSKGASRTNKKTYPVEVLLAAMEKANCLSVIINCYGLEDGIQLSSGEAELKQSQQYINNWADESLGFRADIGGVWLDGGCTSYISLPGSPVGVELYTIGAPLQSLTNFMRFMKHSPEKHADYPGGGWKGGNITAHVTFLRATAGASGESFRISDARSSVAAQAFRNQDVLTPITKRVRQTPSAGVTSVVLYNNGQKHNMVSLLHSSNSSGFELFGTGRLSGQCEGGAPGEPLPGAALRCRRSPLQQPPPRCLLLLRHHHHKPPPPPLLPVSQGGQWFGT
jgi:hypothetical protein